MAKKQAPKKTNRPIPAQKKPVSKPTTPPGTGKSGSLWEPDGWLRFALIAMAITALCYLPSLKNEFVNWDDEPNILENPNLQHIDAQSIRNIFSIDKGAVIGNYNPLPIFTFALEKKIAGDFNPTLVHFTNLLLHVLTVFFAMRLLFHMGIGRWGALFGGLLFGIHPMRVESVAWATERKDVLFAVFFFAALMYYVRWIKTEDNGKRLRLYLIMTVLAVLSLFAKVQAVTLPLSMLVLDYWFRRPINFKLIWEKTPFWILSMVFGLINLYTLGKEGSTNDEVTNFDIVDRLCIGAYSFLVYIFKLFIPYPMLPLYPYPKPLPTEVYVAPIGFLAALAITIYLMVKDRRIWVFGMGFFFFNVMFLLQVLGAGQGFLADRFTYVAYFGFFAIGAWFFDKYHAEPARRPLLNFGAAILFLIYAVVSYRQIGIWENGGTLWSHVIKHEELKIDKEGKAKGNSTPYWNRGQYYREQGDFNSSLKDYARAIEVNPQNPELYNSRGKTYFDMAMSGKFPDKAGQYSKLALEDYTNGLKQEKLKPKTQAELLINRGAARAATGNFAGALEDLNQGIAIDSTNKNGYFNRSLVYFNMQRYPDAVKDYSSYLVFDPYNANVWYERGMIRRSLQQAELAVQDLTRALELDPNFGLAYKERARAHALLGNKAAAQQDYQRAAQFNLPMDSFDQQLMQGGAAQ